MATTDLPTQTAVPAQLVSRAQWLCWRAQERDGKPTKVPIDPTTGAFASSTDPDTWTDFETAREYATRDDVDGLGFVFTDEDPFVGVDLDDCRVPETETTLDWAEDLIARLDSYTERSPSGTGYHVIVSGSLPDGRNRKGDVELYEDARFFTMTGDHVSGTPTTVTDRPEALVAVHEEYVAPDESTTEGNSNDEPAPIESGSSSVDLADEELLERARNAANGTKFERLWRGDTSGYESHSEADMALCSMLAFWTGGDEQRVDQLFRQSGLLREKWDDVHYSDGSTYGETTVARAVAGTDEYYEPSGGSNASSDPATAETDASVQALEAEVARLRDREANRLERVDELQAAVKTLQAENERLEAELKAERRRRAEAEEKLAELQAESLWKRLGWLLR